VTISERIYELSPSVMAAGGVPTWPLIDSLGQPMGSLVARGAGDFTLHDLAGGSYRPTSVRVRGHGCAASLIQQRRFALVQIIAPHAPAGGTQAFIDSAALDKTAPSGRAALGAFEHQVGGGTGCGPSGREVGRVRALTDPAVGSAAHARLSNGQLNTVNEYDAKPAFGNVLYFSSNTTSVSAGGIARGMVRVGTPVAKVDMFAVCDPNSDGTLIWRYWSIHTQNPRHPHLYGWIPARCPAWLQHRSATSPTLQRAGRSP
jgi:hypothetical protein